MPGGAFEGFLVRALRPLMRREEQAHAELAAFARAFASRIDRSAVHLREPARQSKADPEAALVAAARAIAAAEHLEQLFRWLLLSLDRLSSNTSGHDAGTDCGHARSAP
jgi:hypothetical protein